MMASSHRKSNSSPSSSVPVQNFDDPNRSGPKRARYSGGAKYKFKASKSLTLQPILGFQNEMHKPVIRSFLNPDTRFFPIGVQPGLILNINGPQKSGKTFLLTYFIARTLNAHRDKRVALVDTRHKFSVKNLISILAHLNTELQDLKSNLSEPIQNLIKKSPKLASFLNRISVIKCYTPEDLILTLGPRNESAIEKLLLQDPSVSLVAIDCIDNFSFASSLSNSNWSNYSIMEDLKQCVMKTKCPVICTTLIPVEPGVYQRSLFTSFKTANQKSQLSQTGAYQTRAMENHLDNGDDEKLPEINLKIDYSVFTYFIQITPESEATKAKLKHSTMDKLNHYVSAYLRSRHKANTAGSGENHRVKFSIFSDMLWINDA